MPASNDLTTATAPFVVATFTTIPTEHSRVTPTVNLVSTQTLTVNPLTGLVTDPAMLERRPIIVKVQNVPRESRPQWGLSKADIVYEYYIEYGDTRFAAVFYGQDADQVGPVRSARHIDIHLIRMYKAVFLFGGAYEDLLEQLLGADFGYRVIREGPNTIPALYRYEPAGSNYLMADTTEVPGILEKYGIDNSPQDVSGMKFDLSIPGEGVEADQVFVRFSGGMYNYWDYDPGSGRYLRFSETDNDIARTNPTYAPLFDRLTGKQIAVENVVILLAQYSHVDGLEEVFDVDLLGNGKAYLARDGLLFQVNWQRVQALDVLTMVNNDGEPFPLKPGQTWFEVLGITSQAEPIMNGWEFSFAMP